MSTVTVETVQNQVQQMQQKATVVVGQVQQQASAVAGQVHQQASAVAGQVQQKASEVAEQVQQMQQKATVVAGQVQQRASEVAVDSQRLALDQYAKANEQLVAVISKFQASVASLQEMTTQKIGESREAFAQAKEKAGVLAVQAKTVFDEYVSAAEELYKNQVPEKTRNQISAAVQKAREALEMLLKRMDEVFVAVKTSSEKMLIEAVKQINAVTAPLQQQTLALTNQYVVPALDRYAPEGKQKMEEGYAALTSDEDARQRFGTFATCMLQASIMLAKSAAVTGCDLVTDMTTSPKKSIEAKPEKANGHTNHRRTNGTGEHNETDSASSSSTQKSSSAPASS
ncbi:hypothetical protein DIPPA_09320 [Diplonema papillatum]|nr:hypothetical protein DIPPA_09320 [Diplonema papillatum]